MRDPHNLKLANGPADPAAKLSPRSSKIAKG